MAAGTAASRGYDVTLIEKMDRLGIKLSITGGGRCNITRDTDVEDLIKGVLRNREFLYPAFYSLSGKNLMGFFLGLGLGTYADDEGKVYPNTNSARDVVHSLKQYLLKNGVRTRKDRVSEVVVCDGKARGVRTDLDEVIDCECVILATGGRSYPETGSSGDGYAISESAGHKVVETFPTLVPVEIEDDLSDLQGISLESVAVEVRDKDGGWSAERVGNMVFTHYGISGPAVLKLTGDLTEDVNGSTIRIDLFPDLSSRDMDKKLVAIFESGPKKMVMNALGSVIPGKVAGWLLERLDIDKSTRSNQLSRDDRKRLVRELKSLELIPKGLRSYQDAIVTAGGVSVDEIDPKTMESKLVKRLFFAGEIMDVHGTTGGYNLQIAFSTGYLAGMSC